MSDARQEMLPATDPPLWKLIERGMWGWALALVIVLGLIVWLLVAVSHYQLETTSQPRTSLLITAPGGRAAPNVLPSGSSATV